MHFFHEYSLAWDFPSLTAGRLARLLVRISSGRKVSCYSATIAGRKEYNFDIIER